MSDRAKVRRIGETALPQTRSSLTAAAAIAIAVPDDSGKAVSYAYDEGRAAERLLVGAGMLGLAAGVSWILPDKRQAIGSMLDIPPGWFVRTIVAIGHPTEAALAPKSQPGQARLPREQVVFEDRWQS